MAKAAVFVALSLSVTATLLFAGSDACKDAPSMSAVDACKKASTGPAMSKICAATLGTSTAPEEETNFVLAAAKAAAESFVATMDAARLLQQDPSVAGDMRSACLACLDSYNDARVAITAAVSHLKDCSFVEVLMKDFPAATAAVDGCASALLPVGGSASPLYTMIVADRDRSMLGLRLTSLLVDPPN